MNIVSATEGFNIVSRAQAAPPDYPAATAEPAYVEVYWRARNPDEPAPAWAYVCTVAPGGSASIPYNPAVDKNVEIALMPYSASGTPAFSSIDDAFATTGQTLYHQREQDAPVIGQVGDATTDSITVGVSGYSQFARKRRVKIATALDGIGQLVAPITTIFDSTPDAPPPWVDFSRGEGPQTIYVTVAHSSGGAWTPDSNILTLTFASSDGTGGNGEPGSGEPVGGSTGEFDPIPRDSYTYL